MENRIDRLLRSTNYDVRLSKNARWIDQKCTPDVLSIVADCIINYIKENDDSSASFFSTDIWNSSFANEMVIDVFRKPGLSNSSARNEYDKFFQQPMELLAYSRILSKSKIGNRNVYKIVEYDILHYLSIRERNSLFFLIKYITKVLEDSGLLSSFHEFFKTQNSSSYVTLKNRFAEFTIENTNINKHLESNRIFTKVINPLAYYFRSKGTKRGRLSMHEITLDMLMYNQENFRDIYTHKPKDMSRKEYIETVVTLRSNSYTNYIIERAKRSVKEFNMTYNDGKSEVYQNDHSSDLATHRHHIFPLHIFPEIAYFEENIICLTPTQHLNYAHVDGNTSLINTGFQHICLISKSTTIQSSENIQSEVYSFARFLKVLETGHDDQSYLKIEEGEYHVLVNKINAYYNGMP